MTVATSVREASETRKASAQRDEKVRQIMDGARKVFLNEGFDGASMNDIARVAGVSKGTIYFHFESKEALFVAMIREDKRAQIEQNCQLDEHNPDIAEAMVDFACALVRAMTDPGSLSQVRTVVAIAPKFPSLGRAFYEAGPQYGRDRISAWLKTKVEAGVFAIADTDLAAAHLIQLCAGDVHKRLLFCTDENLAPEEVEQVAKAGVAVFMKAYGTCSA